MIRRFIPGILLGIIALVAVLALTDVIPLKQPPVTAPPQILTPTATTIPTPAPIPPTTVPFNVNMGLYLTADVTVDSASGFAEIGFYGPETSGAVNRQYALLFRGADVFAIDGTDQISQPLPDTDRLNRVATIDPGVQYRVLIEAIDPQYGGANFYISGGQQADPDTPWKLVYQSVFLTNQPLHAQAVVHSPDASAEITATATASATVPTLLDDFELDGLRQTGLNGRTPPAGPPESKWEMPDTSMIWTVTEGVATSALNRQIALIETGSADGLIITEAAPWDSEGLALRYVSMESWIGVRRRPSDNSVIVVKFEGIESTTIAETVLGPDTVSGARLEAVLLGDELRVYVNKRHALTAVIDFNPNATRHGLWSFANSGRFRNFAVWSDQPVRP